MYTVSNMGETDPATETSSEHTNIELATEPGAEPSSAQPTIQPKESKARYASRLSGKMLMPVFGLVFVVCVFGMGFAVGLEGSPEPAEPITETVVLNNDPKCTIKAANAEIGKSVTFELTTSVESVSLDDLAIYANGTRLPKSSGLYVLEFEANDEYSVDARSVLDSNAAPLCSYGSVYVADAPQATSPSLTEPQ